MEKIMAGTIVIGGNVARHTRVTLEIGPKERRWWRWHLIGLGSSAGRRPGRSNQKLHSYIPRYSPVAKLAEMDAAFDTIKNFERSSSIQALAQLTSGASRSRFEHR